jgi:hypothetical protein
MPRYDLIDERRRRLPGDRLDRDLDAGRLEGAE